MNRGRKSEREREREWKICALARIRFIDDPVEYQFQVLLFFFFFDKTTGLTRLLDYQINLT